MTRFRPSLTLVLLLLAAPLAAAPPRPYHLELEANPAAPFPFLGKFGTVDLHVYPEGIRADTVWLDGHSRNGTKAVTVENPFGRVYTEVPIGEIASILRKLAGAGGKERAAVATLADPIKGKVGGMDATRHRLIYGAEAWIDVWTTSSVPENAQLQTIVQEFVRGISPGSVTAAKSIRGTPIYVEINFSRFKKLPILKMKSLKWDSEGQDDALKTGTIFFKAPLLDALWK